MLQNDFQRLTIGLFTIFLFIRKDNLTLKWKWMSQDAPIIGLSRSTKCPKASADCNKLISDCRIRIIPLQWVPRLYDKLQNKLSLKTLHFVLSKRHNTEACLVATTWVHVPATGEENTVLKLLFKKWLQTFTAKIRKIGWSGIWLLTVNAVKIKTIIFTFLRSFSCKSSSTTINLNSRLLFLTVKHRNTFMTSRVHVPIVTVCTFKLFLCLCSIQYMLLRPIRWHRILILIKSLAMESTKTLFASKTFDWSTLVNMKYNNC